jgi:hypothetical protein
MVSRKRLAIAVLVLIIVVFFLLVWLFFGQLNLNSGLTPSETTLKTKDTNVFNRILYNSNDFKVNDSKAFTNYVSDAFLTHGLYENVDVINPSQNLYKQEPLSNATVDFFSQYFWSIHQGFPEHNNAILNMLGNMSQNNPDVVNFSPIRLQGINYVDITPTPSRESWSVVDQAKYINESGYDLVNHPEMGLSLSMKVITDNWGLFDNYAGIKYYDTSITPTDQKVRDLVNLQWDLYSQFTPIKNGKVYSDFTWWDSHNLRVNNPNENGLRTSLFYLWQLSPATFSMKDQKIVDGLDGARVSLTQSADEFRAIASLYPNGQVQTEYLGMKDPRFYYYDEMDDRLHHGMSNTISAFVGGWDDSKVKHGDRDGTYSWIQNQNGPDQFITKNWSSYDLARFIIGYERYNPNKGSEDNGIGITTPPILRMAGFPTNIIGISPTPDGASSGEYAVGLPQNVAHSLLASFPNILLGPGYTVSMYSCKDGLLADGIKEAGSSLPSSSEYVYLMKDGE